MLYNLIIHAKRTKCRYLIICTSTDTMFIWYPRVLPILDYKIYENSLLPDESAFILRALARSGVILSFHEKLLIELITWWGSNGWIVELFEF